MPVLYTSYYEKKYNAPWFSCQAASTLIIYIVAFLLPFIFVYRTHGKLINLNFLIVFLLDLYVKE